MLPDGLYKKGHHSLAVQEAVKALIHHVQNKSKKTQLDSSNLIENVFSLKSGVLKFSALQIQSEQDEQTGLNQLFVAPLWD
jgi:uncharacterized protein (TIGR02391 family)